MLSDFAKSCQTLERTVLVGTKTSSKGKASEALLDCILILVEAADEIGLSNTTVVLDIVADVAFAEVKQRLVPARTLGAIMRLSETANEVIAESDPPKFSTTRNLLPPVTLNQRGLSSSV